MLKTQALSSSPVLTRWHTELAPDDVAVETGHSGMALDQLAGLGVYHDGTDLYFDAAETDFAQPALQAVLDTLDIRWMNDRVTQARNEQAAHLRLRHHAAGNVGAGFRWHRAAALVSAAVGGGLGGAINFGVFALVVGQVAAAMNQSPAGFGETSAAPFSGTAAGRSIVANLVGSLPGSLVYGACSGLTATAVRPLVDAVALLLGGGRVTAFVPVDPVLAFPTPSPLESNGWPKEGEAYAAELAAVGRQRADMRSRQTAMLDAGNLFNLKYGSPMFAACHAIRLMVLTALQLRGRSLEAGAGGLFSGAASGVASIGLAVASGAERGCRTVTSDEGQAFPLFLPARTLRRIRGDADPGLRAAVRGVFAGAGAAYVRDVGLRRKLQLGVPAVALAVYVATVPIHVLVPLATWAGYTLREQSASAIAAAGAITLSAFAVAFTVLGRGLSWAGRVGRADLAGQQERRLAEAFSQSLLNFSRRWPQNADRAEVWSLAQLAVLFDDMNQRVMADLEQAVAEGRNQTLEPGADRRLRDAYAAQAQQMRELLVAARGAETTAPGARNAAQRALLESLRQETERLQVCAVDMSEEVDGESDPVITRL